MSNTRIRMYKEGDEKGIIKLFNLVFEREMTEYEWRWKYKGPGNKRVYAVVLEDDEFGIVGHYGGIALRMIHHGKEIKGTVAGDTMIHPRFRSFLIFRNMYNFFVEELLRDSVKMFYGFSPDRVIKLAVERLGIYEKVEVVIEATKGVSFSHDISRYVYKLFPLDFDDERIDTLWNKIKEQLPLAIIRDRSYLKWRYRDHPFFIYELWGLKKRGGNSLAGAAILRRDVDSRLLIMDVICEDKTLPFLLRKIENLASSRRDREIVIWLPNRYRDVLIRLGFTLKASGATVPRSTHPGAMSREDISGKLFYTMGDTDYL